MLHILKMCVFLGKDERHGKRDYDWREGVEFCRQALAVKNCNRLQLSLLHLQNMHVYGVWTITLGNFVFRKNNWVDNAPIFGWQREYELIDKDIKLAESMYIRDSILYVQRR